MQKRVLNSRGTHVDATWHSRPRGSAMRAHAAPARRDVMHIYIYIYIGYSTYSLPIIRR